MANCILVKTGGGQEIKGNASPNQVLRGVTFMSSKSNELQTGTIVTRLGPDYYTTGWVGQDGDSVLYSLPTGYYSTGYASAPLSNFGDAVAGAVLGGMTFTSSTGFKQKGTMPRYGTIVANIKPGSTYTIPSGFHEYGTVSAYLDNLSFTNNNSTMSGGNSGSITVKEDGIYIVTICGIIVDTGRNNLNDVPVIKVNNVNKSSAWTGSCSNNEGNSAWGYARATIFCLKLKTSDTISWSASRHYGCTHSILKINSI